MISIAMQFKKLLRDFGLEAISRYYASYRGIVVDNKDPEFLCRLKLSVPQVYGDDVPNYWAWSKGIYTGIKGGIFALPAIDDTVWVSFENGDARFPIWEYGWYTPFDDVLKKANIDNGEVSTNVFQSLGGHLIELIDKKDNEVIRITDIHGNIIEMNKEGISLVTDKKVSIGKLNNSDEPAVLGNKLLDLLTELLGDIGDVTGIVTNTGVTNAIKTSPQWQLLVNKWTTKFKDFQSQDITLKANN